MRSFFNDVYTTRHKVTSSGHRPCTVPLKSLTGVGSTWSPRKRSRNNRISELRTNGICHLMKTRLLSVKAIHRQRRAVFRLYNNNNNDNNIIIIQTNSCCCCCRHNSPILLHARGEPAWHCHQLDSLLCTRSGQVFNC